MNLTIQLTPDDYVQAVYTHMRPRPVLKWIGYFLISLTLLALGIALWFAFTKHDTFILPLLIMAILAYFIITFLVYYPRRIKKTFWQQKTMQLPCSVTLSDELVSVKSDISDERLPWNHFIRWKEGKNLFMLYQSDALFRLLPKRCFASPDEITQFRQLLQTKLGPAGV